MAITGFSVDANTVGLWRFDEATAITPVDSGANALDLTTLVGTAPTVTTGQIDSARVFSGSNAYTRGSLGSTIENSTLGEWTVEAWIRPSSLATNNRCFFSVGGPTGTNLLIGCFVTTTGALRVEWGANGFSTAASKILVNNGFYHVAIRRQDSGGGNYTASLFINGLLVDTSGTIASTTVSGTPLAQVGQGTNAGNKFAGAIDEIRWSNVARTDLEIWDGFVAGYQNHIGGHSAPIEFDDSEILLSPDQQLGGWAASLPTAPQDVTVISGGSGAGSNFNTGFN